VINFDFVLFYLPPKEKFDSLIQIRYHVKVGITVPKLKIDLITKPAVPSIYYLSFLKYDSSACMEYDIFLHDRKNY